MLLTGMSAALEPRALLWTIELRRVNRYGTRGTSTHRRWRSAVTTASATA